MTYRQWGVLSRGLERLTILEKGAESMVIEDTNHNLSAEQTVALHKTKAAYQSEIEKLRRFGLEP